MLRIKVALVSSLLLLTAGCTRDLTFEEVVGRYETGHYLTVEKAILILNPDCTYEQMFIFEDRDTLRNVGKWTYDYSSVSGAWITLKDPISMSPYTFPYEDKPEKFEGPSTFGPTKFLGDIYIEAEPDFGVNYYKVESEDSDD